MARRLVAAAVAAVAMAVGGLTPLAPSAVADQCAGKSNWPELVGAQGQSAARTIERENRHVQALVVLDPAVDPILTLGFRCDRVLVPVDVNGVVDTIPRIG